MTRLTILTDALNFARAYTVSLLDTIPQADWFRIPEGSPTNVAWQVGHLAVAEGRMIHHRVCGLTGLTTPEMLKLYGRETAADADPANQPSAAELRANLDRVHATSLEALAGLSDADLDEPVTMLPKHRLCTFKWEYVRWIGHHEMIHTGQIGLLRRMLGQPPVW